MKINKNTIIIILVAIIALFFLSSIFSDNDADTSQEPTLPSENLPTQDSQNQEQQPQEPNEPTEPEITEPERELFIVMEVIDGDTIKIDPGESVNVLDAVPSEDDRDIRCDYGF